MVNLSRLLIAGTNSGVGKTTITTGIMAALTKRGYNLQPFKVGPDYIDPGYHTMATGNISRNLDPWLTGEKEVKEIFLKSASEKDISIIEGVMGLFDGIKGTSSQGSSAHIAKLLEAPVILIMDVRAMARSAAAIALGFKSLEKDVNIAGIILNKVGSQSHYAMVKEAIEDSCQIPVLGYLLKNQKLELPERHLGLITTAEGSELATQLEEMVSRVEENIDFDKLLEIANSSPELKIQEPLEVPEQIEKVRIGIAKDKAFTFYYQDGLELLESYGAELVPFSPIEDRKLPENLVGIIIGGGYPEMFLEELSSNTSLMEAIRNHARCGKPIYAECGGQMYLSEEIVAFDGKGYPMVGLVPGKSIMQKRLVAMGYVTVEATKDNILLAKGESYRGHEFHYSLLDGLKESEMALKLTKNRDGSIRKEGFSLDNIFTSYVHLHFGGFPQVAKRFISKCREPKKEH